MPAPHSVVGADAESLRLLKTLLSGKVAAGVELAALGPVKWIWSGTADGLQLLGLGLAQNGDGPEQGRSVGMRGPGEHIFHGAVFHRHTHVHDHNIVGHLGRSEERRVGKECRSGGWPWQ